MPARPEGVYQDAHGGWYFEVSLGRVDAGLVRPSSSVLTVNELLDLYLDGPDADERLSAKTRFDYRHYSDDYVRPLLGPRKVRDLTPEAVVAWQRALTKGGGTPDHRHPT